MHCPNINSPEWNSLVKEVGEVEAWRTFFKYGEVVPVTEVTLKPGVQEVFNLNPELASIGTAEQYSQYLDTIFPDSKVKDIVY